MKFEQLLGYADEGVLQDLLGRRIVRLLGILDAQLLQPPHMREVLLGLRDPISMLADKEARGILFDMLPRDIAKTLQGEVGLAGTDPYAELLSHRFRRNSRSWRSLLDFFEIVECNEPDHDPPETLEIGPASYPLFDHQREAVRRVQAALSTEPRRVLLHMPTGSGKTRTAINVIAEHLRASEPTLVVWLAYSQELCEQAATEFARAWSFLGNRPVSIYRYWGSHKLDLAGLHDGFLIAGLAKAFQTSIDDLHFLGRLGDRARLIVIDEAHQAIAATYSQILRTLLAKRPNNALLGLSATPGRTWASIDTDQELADFFGRKKVTLRVQGFDNPIEFLVSEGYLAKPTFETLEYGGLELTKGEIRSLADSLDVPVSLLRRLGEHERRNLSLVHKISALVGDHNRILVFAVTVDNARLLAGVLRGRGLNARVITGETGPSEREATIAEFRSEDPEPMVLCNYGVLTTGFDAPKTSAVVIARPTKSLVLYSQMVGRGIRGPRAGGNKEALIVTVVDRGLPGFGDLGEAFLNWEDVWDD